MGPTDTSCSRVLWVSSLSFKCIAPPSSENDKLHHDLSRPKTQLSMLKWVDKTSFWIFDYALLLIQKDFIYAFGKFHSSPFFLLLQQRYLYLIVYPILQNLNGARPQTTALQKETKKANKQGSLLKRTFHYNIHECFVKRSSS